RLTLTITNGAPLTIARVDVLAGASGDQFKRRPRPRTVCIYLDAGDCQRFDLKDDENLQHLVLAKPTGASQVTLGVVDIYPAEIDTGSDVANRMSIREVTLYRVP